MFYAQSHNEVIEQRETLERLIDETDLATVLENLAAVCEYKEDHLLSNLQDQVTARAWRKAQSAVFRCAAGASVQGVSA